MGEVKSGIERLTGHKGPDFSFWNPDEERGNQLKKKREGQYTATSRIPPRASDREEGRFLRYIEVSGL